MKYKVKWGEEAFWVGLGTIIGTALVSLLQLLGLEVDSTTQATIVGGFGAFFGTAARVVIGFFLPTPEGQ